MGELRLWYPQILGLAAGNPAVQLRIAEQRRAHALILHLGLLALRVELLIAHEAVTARDLEGNDHAFAHRQTADGGTYLSDDAHRLVTQDVARMHEGTEHLVEV